jgi:hypothetical protein
MLGALPQRFGAPDLSHCAESYTVMRQGLRKLGFPVGGRDTWNDPGQGLLPLPKHGYLGGSASLRSFPCPSS